jgi:predicted AlkP superfamily pyrophosphatase or phosphodiesterase
MLPAPPKSLGRLGEVLKSAFQAVQGEQNEFNFPQKRLFCLLLVDGLGISNLSNAAGHASFLNSSKQEKIYSYFPSTTSTSLTSLFTGLSPASTKFTGYQIYDRKQDAIMNLLSGWDSFQQGEAFQDKTTISQEAAEKGIPFQVVSIASYQDSGLTGATTRGAKFHSANTVEQRFEIARRLTKSETGVIYLYVPELDQTAHAFGSNSAKWLNQVEALDSLVRDFVGELPKDVGFLITADHGVIDVAEESQVFLDDLILQAELLFVGGDTRGLQLYLKDSSKCQDYKVLLENVLADTCYVVQPSELVESGWWGSIPEERYCPDLLVVARKQVALYHRAFAKKKSLLMVGHHGSLTEAEIAIPLYRFNC